MKAKTVECITFVSPYRERDFQLQALMGGILKITQPRGGYTTDARTGDKHFMGPLPKAPDIGINRQGLPDSKNIDSKAEREYIMAITELTQREQQLTAEAQLAKNVYDHLAEWSQRLWQQEEPFELCSKVGALSDADLGDMDALKRSHERFMRTVNSWVAALRF